MNISAVIDYLNKTLGYSIDASFYTHIAKWKNWWEGYYKPFHLYHEKLNGKSIERHIYSLKMGKKVCEDWAALLLNEKTQIVVNDKTSSTFLQGDDQVGGIFGETQFWKHENELVEKAFWSGTGATLLRMDNMLVQGDTVAPDTGTKIRLDYLPADCILPLTVHSGEIIDVAFISEVTFHGETYDYLETHILEPNKGYHITNQYFKEDAGVLSPAALPPGMVESYYTGSEIPLFSILTPNLVKNIRTGSGMGMSILQNALDALKGVDLAFNNFCRDFRLGGKKVFYRQDLTQYDQNGNIVTPDDIMQQLFIQLGDGADAAGMQGDPIHEYNPDLRVSENRDAVQAMLDYLSFKVGFGAKHYQFNGSTVATATQYMGDKQDLAQNASKHNINVESHLQGICRAILWAGKNILGQPVNPDAQISVNFDDGYINDDDTKRERDRQDVRDGLLKPWEYRVKWYGEDEATAKAVLGTAADLQNPFGFKQGGSDAPT